MKKNPSIMPAAGRVHSRRIFALVAALVATLLTSCITQQQVQSIVTDANQQMLLAEIPATGSQLQADPRKATAPDGTVTARIDNFIAQHPDQPALTSPLRLRQAFLHLNQQAIASAQAAFDAIDEKGLNTERDKTLYRLKDTIVWWYERSSSSGSDFARDTEGKVGKTLKLLATEADKVKAIPELRAYLLETRAWIGLKAAGGLEGAARAAAIKNALDPYGAIVEDAGGIKITKDPADSSQPAFSHAARVAVRTDTLLEEAASLAKGVTGAPPPTLVNKDLQNGLKAKLAR